MNPSIRILLAKVGLDGHDRGVKLLARSFRDEGIEVIYTGLWQTPAASVHAAMQEDADVIGISLHSAAHMTIMPEVLKWQKHYGVGDVPVVVGGIIPRADYQSLRDMGVAEVFNPGSSIAEIVCGIRKLAEDADPREIDDLVNGYRRGEVKSLARLITHIQHQGVEGFSPRDAAASESDDRAMVVGITGAPGVGKSSFIAKLAALLRRRELKVAVVAIDPTSPLTGGALLGDRLRMMRAEPDEAFYVRSLSSSNEQGGLGPHVKPIIGLLGGFGFDIILLETVGAGQGDTAILQITKNILLLLMPDSGDDIQFSKAGIMEIASGYVVNKCDLPGADATEGNLLNTVGSDRPIWRVSALHDQGLEQVAEWLTQLPQSA